VLGFLKAPGAGAAMGFGLNGAFDYYRRVGVQESEMPARVPEDKRRFPAYASGGMLNRHVRRFFDRRPHLGGGAVPLVVKRPGLAAKTVDLRVLNVMILPTVTGWSGELHPCANLPSLDPCIERGELGDAEVFASFHGRDKVVTPGGAAAMDHEGGIPFFDGARGPGDLAPAGASASAPEATAKARAVSRRFAGEAGVVRRFSTHAWHNPDAPAQAEGAARAVAAGGMTPLEAALAAGRGAFLPEMSEAELRAETEIDRDFFNAEQREHLKALGCLN